MSDQGERYERGDGFNCFSSGNRRSNSPEIERLDISVKIGTEQFQGDGIYTLSPGLKRGKVLIVNFYEFESKETREGSQRDVENLDSLFEQIGK